MAPGWQKISPQTCFSIFQLEIDMIPLIRRKRGQYIFTDGDQTLNCTCSELSKKTGIDIAHVGHLAKGRTRAIFGTWKCEGSINSCGKLVPVVFKGKGFKYYTFRKVGSSYTVMKTRSDFSRMTGIGPMQVYRASRNLPVRIGEWLMA